MAYGSIGTYLSGASSTTASLAAAPGTTAGDTLFACIYWEGTTSATSVPSGFSSTPVAFLNTSAASRGSWYVYQKDATGSDTGTYNFTLGASAAWREGFVIRFTGRATGANAIDVTPATVELTTAGTSITVPSQTTITDGCDLMLIVSNFNGFNAGTFPAGVTARSTMASGRDLAVATQDNFTPAGATGTKAITGATSGFMKAAVIAIRPASASSNPATLNATVPRVTASLTATATNPATISTEVPRVTASFSAGSINPASLDAAVPLILAELAAEATNSAILDTTIPSLTTSLTAASMNPASLEAMLPLLDSSLSAEMTNPATLNSVLPLLHSDLAAEQVNPALLEAVLPLLRADLSADEVAVNSAVLDVVLPALRTDLTAEAVNPAVLQATLPVLEIFFRAALSSDILVQTGISRLAVPGVSMGELEYLGHLQMTALELIDMRE